MGCFGFDGRDKASTWRPTSRELASAATFEVRNVNFHCSSPALAEALPPCATDKRRWEQRRQGGRREVNDAFQAIPKLAYHPHKYTLLRKTLCHAPLHEHVALLRHRSYAAPPEFRGALGGWISAATGDLILNLVLKSPRPALTTTRGQIWGVIDVIGPNRKVCDAKDLSGGRGSS